MTRTTKHAQKPLRIAIAQLPITGDAHKNGSRVRQAMREAARGGARLIQFPEGMLSGYAKAPIMDWSEVHWPAVRTELELVLCLAAELKLWVVLGSAHPLTPPNRPHNSLYIVSDEGALVTRYDKRMVSHTEVSRFYTPGSKPVVFDVDGYRFGCAVCVEINFPELFSEYSKLKVDCILLSAYPVDAIFYTKARAYASIHAYWVSLSTPADTAAFISSALIGPDGEPVDKIGADRGVVCAALDPSEPRFNIPLNKARPWRASIAGDPRYHEHVSDPRSVNRSCL